VLWWFVGGSVDPRDSLGGLLAELGPGSSLLLRSCAGGTVCSGLLRAGGGTVRLRPGARATGYVGASRTLEQLHPRARIRFIYWASSLGQWARRPCR
jgi:hypothetical protein